MLWLMANKCPGECGALPSSPDSLSTSRARGRYPPPPQHTHTRVSVQAVSAKEVGRGQARDRAALAQVRGQELKTAGSRRSGSRGGDEPSACPGVRAGALPGPQASQCQGANSPVCRPGRAPLVCMEPCEGGSQKARLGPPRGPQENRDPWGLQHPCPPWQCPPGLPTSPSWSVPGA